MTPSTKCYSFIKEFEGLSLKAYPDPATKAEPYTIGYGSTIYKDGRKVRLGDVITNEFAEELLRFEIDKKALGVDTLIHGTSLNQNQFDSLVSFSYNCGLNNFGKSTLLKRVKNNPIDPDIKNQFMKWNKANNLVLKGLTRRRQAESDLYFS